jgi:hypothetical protein
LSFESAPERKIDISILVEFWHSIARRGIPVNSTREQKASRLGEDGLTRSNASALTREQRRSRRKRSVRARTISVRRVSLRPMPGLEELDAEIDALRPQTRSECIEGPRPCPHVSCRFHLYLDVSPRTGAIKLNFPDLEVWELGQSCALDVADGGGTKLEVVGELMNVTRERVRQIELKALGKLEMLRDIRTLRASN